MKYYSLQYVMFLLILVFTQSAQSQTGIFTYPSSDKIYTNTSTKSLLQLPSGSISLLNFCSDDSYKAHIVQLITTSEVGEFKSNTNIDVNNLTELITLTNNSSELSIFGNTSVNKEYSPFQLTIDSNGKQNLSNKISQVYSTLISDVLWYENNYMILYSKVGKNQLYNISLHKVNGESGNIDWLKKISSENNEEADKIVASANGNYYILGKKYNDEVTEFVPLIYKIDKNGNQLWKKAINVPANFNKQSFYITPNNELIYVCGYTNNPTGFSETRIIKISNTGDEIHSNSINDFSANGIIGVNDQTYLIFGSKFLVDKKQVVTKGKYVIINSQLSDIFAKTLDKTDKPDVDINGDSQTSSDFICASKLKNGRIALGGQVFMPNANKKNNAALLMIINADGSY